MFSMENKELDDLVAKYIKEEISSEELSKLKVSEEFLEYKRILDLSSGFKAPKINVEESYNKFIEKSEAKSKPIISLKKSYILSGIAASLLFIFGLFQFFNSGDVYTTEYGEQLAVTLPDSSKVILNSSSSLKFNNKNWSEKRIITLEGEAFFKVKKGSKFKVITNEGSVSVLGTQFNVNENKSFLEVHCFEGKVKVERNGEQRIIVRGEAVRQIGDDKFEKWSISKEKPSWENFESEFKNTPLAYVFDGLKRIYGVDVKTGEVNLNQRFSGSFSNNDLNVALETIAGSMNLDYTLVNKKEVIFKYQ